MLWSHVVFLTHRIATGYQQTAHNTRGQGRI